MININYFSNNRLEFFDIIFYFLNRIKAENKNHVQINILSNESDIKFFLEKKEKLDLKINILSFKNEFNYTSKLHYAINTNSEFSVKLDEDCIINNHIWDYIIENVKLLNDNNNLLLSPLLSTTLPSCDLFIENVLSKEQRNIIYTHFLNRSMPNGLWGVDYTLLNECTVRSKEWNPSNFLKMLNDLPSDLKGLHPMRISYEAQIDINKFILTNYEKIIEKNDYNTIEIESPYFTNNLFLIKTNVWKNIVDSVGGVYDEIPISNYKRKNNKKFLFIDKGFGVHTMFNTIYGNNNPWNIGMPIGVAEQEEIKFVKELQKIIMI